jgi:hypothetical protein
MKCDIQRQRKTVVINNLSRPRGLAAYDNKLYYVDAARETITMVDVTSFHSKHILKANIPALSQLKVYYERHSKGFICSHHTY